jgi:hypothetical protein
MPECAVPAEAAHEHFWLAVSCQAGARTAPDMQLTALRGSLHRGFCHGRCLKLCQTFCELPSHRSHDPDVQVLRLRRRRQLRMASLWRWEGPARALGPPSRSCASAQRPCSPGAPACSKMQQPPSLPPLALIAISHHLIAVVYWLTEQETLLLFTQYLQNKTHLRL